MTIEHPIDEIGEMLILVSKNLDKNSYILTVPFYHWSYEQENGKEILFHGGPSSFRYDKYKPYLLMP